MATAHLLNKNGYNVTVIEKNEEVGGSMDTVFEKGYLFDRGPNSGLETSPLIKEIVEDLNLQNEMVYANKESNKRYILRDGELHPLPMSPPAFLKTKLFSTKAKLRLVAEPLIGRSKDGYYQSIAEFVQRRLGREFLDYAINPFVAGVYAGNPEDLSVKSAFPKLYALEENYGGLIVGTIKSIKERKKRAEKSKQSAKMFSFVNGMQTLPKEIAKSLGNKVITGAEVTSVEKKQNGWTVVYNKESKAESINCELLISTIPAYIGANMFKSLDAALVEHLEKIYYPPVLVLYLGYKKDQIGKPLDGFGYLIPAKEKKSYLGAIWSSVIFPNRAEDGNASFTLFVGGSRNPEVGNFDRDVITGKVIEEFQHIMKINGKPNFISYRFWHKAIPQYNIGYIEHERYFEEFEKNNPGLFISGNFRGGISVGDCIKSAGLTFEKAKEYLG